MPVHRHGEGMSENSGTSDGVDDAGATFDQTNGLMDQFEGEDDTQDAGEESAPDAIANALRPGGQSGEVGDVADGEEPHLDPDERNP